MPSENHPGGFLERARQELKKRPPDERVRDFLEIYAPRWARAHLEAQGRRCMDCGVPVCMGGCPLGNLIPEWNDLVSKGRWREAYARLEATNNFPEFTGYTCPAPCEDACVLAINDGPVTIKDIERALSDLAWAEGWVRPRRPRRETGYKIAVVGSGPAGLACAQQLRRVGHAVTVFERDDEPGGLMLYGIPDFKFAKWRVRRRLEQLAAEGVQFRCRTAVGRDVPLGALLERFDVVCLAIGAQKPRDVQLPGRELQGIVFAMPYLTHENRRQAGKLARPDEALWAEGKRVVVLGGGDTGADCVATALRQGAKEVVQISIREKPPVERPPDNPWPYLPKVYRKTYAVEEGAVEEFGVDTVAFLDRDGDGWVDALEAERVRWTYDARGRRVSKRVLERGLIIPADLVIIAAGFLGPDAEALEREGVALTPEGVIQTDDGMKTTRERVFACGDARLGASLVVWAIAEGREAARRIDQMLRGETELPPSGLGTPNPPLGPRA